MFILIVFYWVFIACGRLDGMCELGVKEWDICAGILLVVEAGGTVINYDKTQPVRWINIILIFNIQYIFRLICPNVNLFVHQI